VHSDDELQALHDIERRLRWESPELARLFNSDELQSVKSQRQRAKARVLLAAAAVTGWRYWAAHAQRGRSPETAAPAAAAHRAYRQRHRRAGRSFFGCGRADWPGRGRGHIPRTLQPSPRRLPPWPMCGGGIGCLLDRGTRASRVSCSRWVDVSTNKRPSAPTSTTTTARAELERK
jgi:hypothetical protein